MFRCAGVQVSSFYHRFMLGQPGVEERPPARVREEAGGRGRARLSSGPRKGVTVCRKTFNGSCSQFQ